MNAKHLIYFCEDIGSVFESQVMELILFLTEKRVFDKVSLFLGFRNDSDRQAFQLRKLPREIKIIYYRSYPNYLFLNYLIRKTISQALKHSNINIEESVLHVRGELLSYHLSKVIDKKYYQNILPDIRGTSVEEIKDFSNLNIFQIYLKLWGYKKALVNLKEFKHISVVSQSLKNYLVTKYKIKSDSIAITPSLAGKKFKFEKSERNKIRHELGLTEDDNLFVFSSGGTALWQNNRVFTTLAHKGIKVLNLSKSEIHSENVINKFLDYHSVPQYLNAADIAVIWRDKSIVNEVASPVKFSEYICCGLPVICNNSVTMISDYIKSSSYGYILENLDDLNIEKIKELKALNRDEISANGQMWLGIIKIADDYLQIYSRIK